MGSGAMWIFGGAASEITWAVGNVFRWSKPIEIYMGGGAMWWVKPIEITWAVEQCGFWWSIAH
jgi:hypothetical protein